MIWIISGTQDGREIGAKLADWIKTQPRIRDTEILMTVVSQYGKRLACHEGIEVEVGRFTEEDMLREISGKKITVILDCSHPYAAVVSETARIPMRRSCRKRRGRPAGRRGLLMSGMKDRKSRCLIMRSCITRPMKRKRRRSPARWETISFSRRDRKRWRLSSMRMR